LLVKLKVYTYDPFEVIAHVALFAVVNGFEQVAPQVELLPHGLKHFIHLDPSYYAQLSVIVSLTLTF